MNLFAYNTHDVETPVCGGSCPLAVALTFSRCDRSPPPRAVTEAAARNLPIMHLDYVPILGKGEPSFQEWSTELAEVASYEKISFNINDRTERPSAGGSAEEDMGGSPRPPAPRQPREPHTSGSLERRLEELEKELLRERQENNRLLKDNEENQDLIGKLKEEIDLLNRDLDDIEDENDQLKQENKTLLKVVGQLTRNISPSPLSTPLRQALLQQATRTEQKISHSHKVWARPRTMGKSNRVTLGRGQRRFHADPIHSPGWNLHANNHTVQQNRTDFIHDLTFSRATQRRRRGHMTEKVRCHATLPSTNHMLKLKRSFDVLMNDPKLS
ncbi:unnamed protein product [Gadus morhua 'NCC']